MTLLVCGWVGTLWKYRNNIVLLYYISGSSIEKNYYSQWWILGFIYRTHTYYSYTDSFQNWFTNVSIPGIVWYTNLFALQRYIWNRSDIRLNLYVSTCTLGKGTSKEHTSLGWKMNLLTCFSVFYVNLRALMTILT